MLDKKVLYSIRKCPSNIYPYLSEIKYFDLKDLFDYCSVDDDLKDQNQKKCDMLEEFLKAGLNPKLINADVQRAIFAHIYNVEAYILRSDLIKLVNLFFDNNIDMSNLTKYRLLTMFDYNDKEDKKILSRIDFFTDSVYDNEGNFFDYAVSTILDGQGSFETMQKIFTHIKPSKLKPDTLLHALFIFINVYPEEISKGKSNITFILNELFKPGQYDTDMEKIYDFIVHNKGILYYITSHNPSLLNNLPEKMRPVARQTCLNEKLFQIIGSDTESQMAYCISVGPKQLHKITIQLDPKVQTYVDIVKSINDNNNIDITYSDIAHDYTIINALIDTKFDNKLVWYKLMENLLIANPDMPSDVIKHMLDKEPNVKPLVKKYHTPQQDVPVKKRGILASFFTRKR